MHFTSRRKALDDLYSRTTEEERNRWRDQLGTALLPQEHINPDLPIPGHFLAANGVTTPCNPDASEDRGLCRVCGLDCILPCGRSDCPLQGSVVP